MDPESYLQPADEATLTAWSFMPVRIHSSCHDAVADQRHDTAGHSQQGVATLPTTGIHGKEHWRVAKSKSGLGALAMDLYIIDVKNVFLCFL